MTQRGLDLVSPRAPVELPANNAITYWNLFLLKSTSLNSFALVCGLPGEEEEEEGKGVRRRYVGCTELFYGTCSMVLAGSFELQREIRPYMVSVDLDSTKINK